MTLAPGTRLGPFEIVSLLGAGAMGQVYRARDTQLKRDIALKVLPAEVATDPEQLARFQREAELLAALNHSHIAQIHGLAEAGGVRALVMELVEGETLAVRIARGPMPLDEALTLAQQVAEALEYAHERGIIHRDLKPANVTVTPDGTIKVLDFGLAKALEVRPWTGDPCESPTMTSPAMTQVGLVMGTAAYMSPEQARGAAVDKRADIWAFGVVLFEMLTGRPCFAGNSVTDVLAAVIRGEPDWASLPADTPSRLRDLLHRCLAKDRKERLRDIGDARLAIEDAGSQQLDSPQPLHRTTASSRRVPWALAVIMTLIAAALAARLALAPAPSQRQVHRFRLSLPEPVNEDGGTRSLAISPNGTQLAYVGGRVPATRIYYRRLEDLDFRVLPGSEGAAGLFFSPDGRWIGFLAEGKLKRLLIAGGQVENISASVGPQASGANWESDQKVYFSQSWSSGIFRADATTSEGTPECVLPPDPGQWERGLVWPQRLPVEDLVLFTVFAGDIASMNDARIAIGRLGDPRKRWALSTGGTCARFLPTGHVVYSRDGNLMAAALDLGTRTISDPVVAVRRVRMYPLTGSASFAVANTGTLVYVEGDIIRGRDELVLIDRRGARSVIAPENGFISSPSVSADGGQILVNMHSANDDIDVYRLSSGTFSRVTFEDGDERSPTWLPGSQSFAYSTEAGPTAKMFVRHADGSGKAQPLFPSDTSRYPGSSQGKILAFLERSLATDWDIWTGTLGTGGQAQPFLNTKYAESSPSLSPDGRWMAYESNESGRQTEVYVVRFPEGTDKVQVSVDGGTEPRWAPTGTELYYRNGRRFVAVETALEPSFLVRRRTVLFETDDGIFSRRGPPWGSYAVMREGRGFVFIDNSKTTPPRELVVVLNWFEELKAKAPIPK